MANVNEGKVTSLPQYLKLVEDARARSSGSLWYRGCGKSAYPLLPSLYRHERLKAPDELADLERQLMTRFRQRSIPYHSRSLTDDWDTLFFMQHYGVPTRLLDWTENPLIALHFALLGAIKTPTKAGKLAFRADAAVWALDPVAWNRHALRHVTFEGGVLRRR
jgi:FRG domain